MRRAEETGTPLSMNLAGAFPAHAFEGVNGRETEAHTASTSSQEPRPEAHDTQGFESCQRPPREPGRGSLPGWAFR